MNLLLKLKNAILVKKNCLSIHFKKKYFFTLNLLTKYKYIYGFVITIKKGNLYLLIYLKYKGSWIKTSAIYTIKGISNPGQRIFITYKKTMTTIPNLKYKSGLGIISCSFGFMNVCKAFKYKIGGEYLYYFN